MKLIIAEKPSVAKDIALVLGAKRTASTTSGCIEAGEYTISWAIGHLIGLAEADHYNPSYKRWRLEDLPILPPGFELTVLKKTAKQFAVLKRLLHSADLVVNACDAGREGELIFRYVLQAAQYRGPAERLWLSSLTPEAIRNAMAQLQPLSAYDRLYEGAKCRAESDWLIGINATRALTCRFGGLLTCGRVQTPTLALIVSREKAIQAFQPETFHEVKATFLTDVGEYEGTWFDGAPSVHQPNSSGDFHGSTAPNGETEDDPISIGTRISDRALADQIVQRILDGRGSVQSVEIQKQVDHPPRLFDLTDLQRTANRLFGFTAKRTLERLQSLYEKHKAITYPRTDSAYVSKDIVPTFPARMKAISVQPFAAALVQKLPSPLPATKRFVDDAKVTDHHAIIPTEKTPKPESWTEDERKLYELISRRFLAVFFPPAEWERTSITTAVNEDLFLTRGRVLKKAGWRVTEPDRSQTANDQLPPVVRGMSATVVGADVATKQTQPPKRYTEATLLRAMETCGRDTDFAEVMKERGLGTPATRAGVIEKLKDVGYISTQGKQLVPTEKGMGLIQVIPVVALTSAEMTGEWEEALRQIESGERSGAQFMQQIRRYAAHAVEAIREANGDIQMKDVSGRRSTNRRAKGKQSSSEGSRTPKRTKSQSQRTGTRSTTVGAAQRTTDSKTLMSAVHSDDAAANTGADTAPASTHLPREKKKRGNSRKTGSTTAQSANTKRTGRLEGWPACPSCGSSIVERPTFWGCSGWTNGCQLKIWKTVSQRAVQPDEAQALLRQGMTEVLDFISPRTGRAFRARLTLADGSVSLTFENTRSATRRQPQ